MGHVIFHGGSSHEKQTERNRPIGSKAAALQLLEKQQLVAATLRPGASVAAVAREAGIHATQLYGKGLAA
jgi:hypothetical protein